MTGADRASATTRVRLGAGSLIAALGVVVATAAATQVPAGAGAPAPDKTIPTLPPASSDVPATTTGPTVVESSGPATSVTESTEVVVPESTVAAIETGIPLSAGAGPAELFAAANRALESESDITAGLAGFAVMPTGIPTPAGATVNTISVSYSATLESYVASAEFTTSATAEDVIAYYQTMLTAEGFAATLVVAEEGVSELEFARSEPDPGDAAIRVSIDSSDAVTVAIEITDHAEPETLEAFAGWPAGLPGLDDGRPIEARVTATRDGATRVTMSTTFAYEAITVDELTALIRDGLANGGGGFRIADADEGGATITLDHAIINDAIASVSDVDGVTQLTIDGSLG
jgi:hypothetical protein